MTNAFALRPLAPTPIGSPTAGGSSDAYMFNDYLGVVWQSVAPSSGTIGDLLLDFGASGPSWDTLMLFGCTGATSAWEWRVLGTGTGDFSVIVSDSGWMPFLAGSQMPVHGRGVALFQNATLIAARFARIQFRSLTGPLVIGRLAIGAKLQLGRNFGFGGGWGVRDLGKVDWSPAGALLRRQAAKLRTIGISFSNAYKNEVETAIQPLIQQRAGQQPIALCTDPSVDATRQTRCWFGPLIGDLGTVWRNPSAWEWKVSLVDLVPIPKDVI